MLVPWVVPYREADIRDTMHGMSCKFLLSSTVKRCYCAPSQSVNFAIRISLPGWQPGEMLLCPVCCLDMAGGSSET